MKYLIILTTVLMAGNANAQNNFMQPHQFMQPAFQSSPQPYIPQHNFQPSQQDLIAAIEYRRLLEQEAARLEREEILNNHIEQNARTRSSY